MTELIAIPKADEWSGWEAFVLDSVSPRLRGGCTTSAWMRAGKSHHGGRTVKVEA
jgi:hypothetical protein